VFVYVCLYIHIYMYIFLALQLLDGLTKSKWVVTDHSWKPCWQSEDVGLLLHSDFALRIPAHVISAGV
jgi:hypothetical protein